MYVVMQSITACRSATARQLVKAHKVAVVEIDTAWSVTQRLLGNSGIPPRIDPRLKCIKRIVTLWKCVSVGNLDTALRTLQEQADELNQQERQDAA